MGTTIAVQESTLQVLEQVKKQLQADSYDETIVKVLQKIQNLPKSRFGSQPHLKRFKETERAGFHEL